MTPYQAIWRHCYFQNEEGLVAELRVEDDEDWQDLACDMCEWYDMVKHLIV